MKQVVFTFLLALTLFLDEATTILDNTTTYSDSVSDNVGIIISLWNHNKNNAFKQRINLIPFSHLNITVTDIPPDIWFIILQIHTFQYNATIAYDKDLLDKVSSRSLFGSNIGLYLKTYNVTTPIQVFLKHYNLHNLDALLTIVAYDRNAPIPGGCNMEFDIEIAPYQKLHTENEMIIVDTQPASILAGNGLPTLCETNPVQHKMYRLYLPRQDFTPDTYFEAIASMLTTQDIVQNGDEIPPTLTSPMRRIYSAYTGTGSVYAAIAINGNYSSAYIPIFTYACSPLLYPETCQVLNDTFAEMICALVLIIGFLLVIIGHKYAYIDRLISSCMMGGIFGYTLAIGISDYSTTINILIGSISAILAVTLSAFLRSTCDLCIFLCNLPLGFLCTCITYLYAPVWMFYILEHDWLFWPMFVSLMLTVAIPLTKMPYIAEIITRVVFGSYFVIIAIDYYIGSNLKYIILTLIRRVTISEFHLAFVYPPYQHADVILIITWFVLIIVQFLIQGCTKLCRKMSVVESAGNNTETTVLIPKQRKRFYHRYYRKSNNRYNVL
ncbi:transmembrane 7 superfamily member 3-like [Cataglyphis hispanica]|uniref:transmembrane 7 superfamily member 3-like n=1 Tax=Cataglyphis hispanica TaxID=1086592 RepID=UPI00217FB3FA|nr:transmembrane 7 superfamily member 3-like [Cataglyphis hispanica]